MGLADGLDVVRAVCVALVAVVVGACGGAARTSTADEWGASAQEWRAAFYEAGAEGAPNVLNFLAEDVVFEDRIAAGVIRGWDDFLAHGRSVVGGVADSHPVAMFLSAEGFLDQYYWIASGEIDLLDRVEIEDAKVTLGVVGGATESGRRHHVDTRDFDAIERLADRYVSAWNGEVEVADVYAPGARIDDTLLGLSAEGIDDIVGIMDSGAELVLASPHIADLPDHPDRPPDPGQSSGRAIYISPSDVDPALPDEIRLVLESDDGTGCPGVVAVSLEVTDGLVLAERRYHEPSSIRRCRDVATLQPGWWEGIEIPDPVRLERTDPMVWPERDLTVEIFNGRPETTGFVRWGLERFEAADLPLPRVGSVTFLADRSRCAGRGGFYTPRDPLPGDVTLCTTAQQTCLDEACATWTVPGRHMLVHEYAHAWLDQQLDDDARHEFLRLMDLAGWSDHTDDWSDRGVEHAAEAIVVGLLQEPRPGGLFDETTSCEEYLAGFRVLTGREPLTQCP